MKHVTNSSTQNSSPFSSLEILIESLDIIQGCCLIHYPTKQLIGIDCRGIDLFLQRINSFCNENGKKTKNNKSESNKKSMILEFEILEPSVIQSCFDCLLAIMVDQEICQIQFRHQDGVSYIVKILKLKNQELRYEFY